MNSAAKTSRTKKIHYCAYGCGREVSMANLGCGEGECLAKHNAAATAARSEGAAKAAATRKANAGKPRKQTIGGEFGAFMMLANPKLAKMIEEANK